MRPRSRLDDRWALPGLLLVAAVMRLPDLATRGTWDADQGHDMLVLRTFVRDGIAPLLGPPTSIGDIHHGAWYYYLLTPAAWLTGGDSPLAVVGLIALGGIAAVGVVWWLARSIAGPVAGLVAGLVLATSAAAIDESTFIWNPNLIVLSSAVALAAAWRAWSGHSRRWWVVAAIGTAVTMQCHVLGIALLPIVAAPFLLDARRRPLGPVALVVLATFAIAYLPLVLNELTNDFSEARAAIDYIGARGTSAEVTVPVRFGIVGLRVISWPLTGLITDGFVAGSLALLAIVVIIVWRWVAGRDDDGLVARWFGLGLLWTVGFLTIAAPSLASVVRGLPNDHYHAFADPMVVVLIGIGAAALIRDMTAPLGPGLAVAGVAAVVGWNVLHLPPAVHPDGGFPRADAAARRVDQALEGRGIDRRRPFQLDSLPEFKSAEAMVYPVARLGRAYAASLPNDTPVLGSSPAPEPSAGLVILCDQLFRDAIRADCGGPAEDGLAAETAGGPALLVDRFEVAPGRWVSVYAGPSP